MSSRTCPDWPDLMEIAPDLQFKHYTLAEAKLPADVLMTLEGVSVEDVAICCDIDKHVFFAGHTDLRLVDALRQSHWFDLSEWTTSGPGAAIGY
jgi:hypothetical protein